MIPEHDPNDPGFDFSSPYVRLALALYVILLIIIALITEWN